MKSAKTWAEAIYKAFAEGQIEGIYENTGKINKRFKTKILNISKECQIEALEAASVIADKVEAGNSHHVQMQEEIVKAIRKLKEQMK